MSNPTGREQFEAENRRRTLEKLGISPREERGYSLSRALLAVAEGVKPYGFEGEVDAEMRRQFPTTNTRENNIVVPTGLAIARRDLSAGTPSTGGYLVSTGNIAGTFIDLLRSRLIVEKLGAVFLPNLTGNVTIPKLATASTAYWLATDGTSITESTPSLGQLSLSPKTVGAYTEFTRQLLMQSSPGVDTMVATDLARVIALAVDAAVLNGSGSGGQPTGIINTAGIGSVSGGTLGWAGAIEFLTDLGGSNALQDAAKLGFATTPAVAALLKQRQRFTGTDSPVWEGNILNGTIAGMPAVSSNGMPTASMLCGDWAQVLIGEWGVLEIATNPYAAFSSGIVGVRAMQSLDVGVRVPGAFSLATSIT